MVAGGAGGGLYCFREQSAARSQQTLRNILHLGAGGAAGGRGGTETETETGPHILIELHRAGGTVARQAFLLLKLYIIK